MIITRRPLRINLGGRGTDFSWPDYRLSAHIRQPAADKRRTSV
jgi:galactokinase/mevalonate kinase-like predicted kinase